MADDLGTLISKLAADASDLKRGLAEGRAGLKNFQDMATSAGATIKKALTFTFALAGIGLGLNEIKNFAKASVASFVEINAAAKGLSVIMGSSVSDAGALAGAFRRVGVDTETVSASLIKMIRQLKTNEDAFTRNGIATRDASGNFLSMNEILFNSVDRLKQLEAGTERNMLATDLFGRSVGNMPGFLKMSQEAVDQYKEKLASLGITIDDLSSAKARAFKEGMRDVDLIFDAMKYKVGGEIVPSIITIARAFAAIGPDIAAAITGVINMLTSLVMGVQVSMVNIRSAWGFSVDYISSLSRVLSDVYWRLFTDVGEAASEGYAKLKRLSADWARQAAADANTVRFNIMAALPQSPQKPDRPGIMGLGTALPVTSPPEEKPSDKYVGTAKAGGAKSAKETTDNLLAPLLAMYKVKREADLQEAQNSLDLLKSTNDRKRAILAKDLAEGLIDGQTYYQRLQELQQQETAAAIAMIGQKRQAQQKAYQESLTQVEADAKLSEDAKSIARQKFEAENRKALSKLDTEAIQAKLDGEAKVANELRRQVDLRKQYEDSTAALNIDTAQLLGAISEQEATLMQLNLDWKRNRDAAIKAGLSPSDPFFEAGEKNLEAKKAHVLYGGYASQITQGISSLADALASGTADLKKSLNSMFKGVFNESIKPGIDQLKNLLVSGFKEIFGTAGGAIANAVMGVIGLVGMMLTSRGSKSWSASSVQGGVTGHEAVRGIIAGETSLPIAQIGVSLAEALTPTNGILLRIEDKIGNMGGGNSGGGTIIQVNAISPESLKNFLDSYFANYLMQGA